ncbi:MAG: formate--tetrahydrofolate ligase [Isosphaeraceae bacterium]
MGPVFGRKGEATGGSARAGSFRRHQPQFTGDFHAITAALNLLAA